MGLAGALRLQPTTNPSHQEPPPLLLQNHHPLRFQLHQRELSMKKMIISQPASKLHPPKRPRDRQLTLTWLTGGRSADLSTLWVEASVSSHTNRGAALVYAVAPPTGSADTSSSFSSKSCQNFVYLPILVLAQMLHLRRTSFGCSRIQLCWPAHHGTAHRGKIFEPNPCSVAVLPG